MREDSNSAVPVATPDVGSIEICLNCGQRFPASQVHQCLSVMETQMPGQAPHPAGAAPADDAGLIGKVLGNDQYLVLERVSQGGMGVVYKARHVQLASLVAVKVLHQANDPSFQQRFVREAQLAAKVKHPNIVYISDFGVLPDGGSFLVMEYLEGKTLTQAMSGFRLEVRRALRITLQIVRGMLAAHEQGIIHRGLQILRFPTEKAKKYLLGNAQETCRFLRPDRREAN
jgi:predicted Ser/Thr protein kinase